MIKNFEIPLPPVEEQKRIVEYLDKLQKKVETLKRYQEETKGEIEAATQAVLKRAFTEYKNLSDFPYFNFHHNSTHFRKSDIV